MNKSVLLIDDDKVLNFLTASAFKRSSHINEVHVSYDGREALDLLSKLTHTPDFILLDISMPTMNGFEFLDRYDQLGYSNKTKIAIYTSSIEKEDKEKAKQYKNVVDFIVKPLSTEKLQEIVLSM